MLILEIGGEGADVETRKWGSRVTEDKNVYPLKMHTPWKYIPPWKCIPLENMHPLKMHTPFRIFLPSSLIYLLKFCLFLLNGYCSLNKKLIPTGSLFCLILLCAFYLFYPVLFYLVSFCYFIQFCFISFCFSVLYLSDIIYPISLLILLYRVFRRKVP